MKMRIRSIIAVIITCMIISMLGCLHGAAEGMTGVVRATSLNVRTGAGTGYPILQDAGEDVKLPDGSTVNIMEVLNDWYKVSFTYNEKIFTGYVSAEYVELKQQVQPPPKVIYKTVTSYAPIHVAAKTKKKVYVKKSANGKNLIYKRKSVKLGRGRSVTVKGQVKKRKAIWYQIRFRHKGKARTAYVRADEVKLNLKNPASAVVFNVSNAVNVRKNASLSSKQLKISGKKVRLKKNSAVSLKREKTKKQGKWFYVSFLYKNKIRSGYIKSNYIKLTKTKKTIRKPISALSDAQFEAYMNTQKFPASYKPGLRALHKAYPFWQFTAYHTNIQWSEALKNESKVGLNLLPNSYGTDWKSREPGAYNASTGKYTVFDGSSWVSASKKAIAYYMDSRNFLTESGIFQFELLGYQADYQSAAGVGNILKNTPFRSGKTFTYWNEAASANRTISYINAIAEGGKVSQVSPYHMAARIRQEVVLGIDSVSNSVSGKMSGYAGIYNFYNIGANDGKNPIANGLKWASSGTTYMRPWNNPYKAIVGGASYIGENYIRKGQNTLYLEKFNVTAKSRYTHQYMSNVEAAYSEAVNTRKAYGNSLDEMPIVFSVPVYLNMPENVSVKPGGAGYY